MLEQRTSAPDAEGYLRDTFAAIDTVWGSVEGLRGAAYAAGVQLEDRQTHRIELRWREPTGFDHLRVEGTTHRFKVRDARDPDGRRRTLEIMAEEATAP